MGNESQALSKSETASLLSLVRHNGLDASRLQCEFSRQRDSGHRHIGGGGFIQSYNIHYDLMLCTYCGNAFPQKPCCPEKLRRLRDSLLLSLPSE